MKKFLIQFALLIVVIFLGLSIFTGSIPSISFIPSQTRVGEVLINDNKQSLLPGNKIKVEIADTQAKRSEGLGGRESLASDSGMLFIFPKEDKYPFWMKGLNFPLDFVWIKGDRVVDILKNVPPPAKETKDESLSVYLPKEAVDKVLEVNSGTVERLNIKVGDSVQIVK